MMTARVNIRHGVSGREAAAVQNSRSHASCAVRSNLPWLRAIFDAAPDPIFLVDPVTMACLGANRAACRALGYSAQHFDGMEVRQLVAKPSYEPVAREFASLAKAPADGAIVDALLRAKDGSLLPARWHIQATAAPDAPPAIVFSREPAGVASEQPQASLAGLLLTDLGHDPLTRLPNRRLFEKRLERALKLMRRNPDYAFAVLFVDLDGFKAVNDTYGHLAGDYVLREAARRLARCVRPRDVVARRGGDEFTVLVEDVRDADDAVRVAQRIQANVERPLKLDGRALEISASIGIALGSRHHGRPQSVLRDADRAMYLSKSLQQSPQVFNPDDHSPRRNGLNGRKTSVATRAVDKPPDQPCRPIENGPLPSGGSAPAPACEPRLAK